MSTLTTYPPTPSETPTPCRGTDVFDFLHTEKREPAPEECLTVRETETQGLVSVTLVKPDGCSLSRKVPATSWQQKEYRGALIQSMWALVA